MCPDDDGWGWVPHRLQSSLGGGGGLSGVYRLMLGLKGGRMLRGQVDQHWSRVVCLAVLWLVLMEQSKV